jgi:hypothetical protein
LGYEAVGQRYLAGTITSILPVYCTELL